MHNFKDTIRLLENSHFFYVIIAGMDGNYHYVNKNYASAFKHISAEIVGKPYFLTMHPDDSKVCEEVSAMCFKFPDRSFPATIRKHDGRGGYIVTQWEYTAMFDEEGAPSGVFCMGHDITEVVVANQELEVAKTEIEEKNNILDQIVWEQSHILRRPLANIIGLVSILNKMEIDQNLKNICEMLIESSTQLDEAVHNIVKKKGA
jgi:PAS domain S-box-containing protein